MAAVDPVTVRQELVNATAKFQELQYDVTLFNDWVHKLQGKLRSHGETANTVDLLLHLQNAYLSSNNTDFVTYIKQKISSSHDGSTDPLTPKGLMGFARKYYDYLAKQTQLAQLANKVNNPSGGDPLVALQAQVQSLAAAVTSQNNHKGKKGKAQGKATSQTPKKKKGNGKGNTRNSGKQKFPTAKLLKMAKPSDTSKFKMVDGWKVWYCTFHNAWGRHTTPECNAKKQAEAQAPQGTGPGPGSASRGPTAQPALTPANIQAFQVFLEGQGMI